MPAPFLFLWPRAAPSIDEVGPGTVCMPAAGESGGVFDSDPASQPSSRPSLALLLRAAAVGVVIVGTAVALPHVMRRWKRARRNAKARTEPNQLLSLDRPLQHTYVMVRHGESTANVAAVISSDPKISTVEHGLTPRGAEQVAQELALWSRSLPPQPILVVSSDFTRARETAQIIHQRLRVRHPLQLHVSLRERFFGEWNGTHTENYARVWEGDVKDAEHEERGVESVASVVRRATQLICDLEAGLLHPPGMTRRGSECSAPTSPPSAPAGQHIHTLGSRAPSAAASTGASPLEGSPKAKPRGMHGNIHSLDTLGPSPSDPLLGVFSLVRALLSSVSMLLRVMTGRMPAAQAVAAAPATAVAPAPSAAGATVSTPSSPSCPRLTVVLVAHGDVAQILATAFMRMDSRFHRSLPHWRNAEGRVLQLKTDAEIEAEAQAAAAATSDPASVDSAAAAAPAAENPPADASDAPPLIYVAAP